ncbi:cell division protein FtsQ/DivIB [Clostridium paraputrificum]|uniref:cell division protein FtsQ/DivIB n=1 Tax=Clostridium paraputrificum TaxID=29363 RepID=UPI003D3476F9
MLTNKKYGIGMIMAKSDNMYIRRAKRKRLIKRQIILSIFLIICGVIFVTKTDTFKIKDIKCTGEVLLTEDYIISQTKDLIDKNIFGINKNDIKKSVKGNPYVKSIEIKRKLPKTLVIEVLEKKGLYYIKDGSSYNIISSELVLLERLESIEDKKLIEIRGLVMDNVNLGEKISDNVRLQNLLEEFYKQEEVIESKNEEFSIEAIDVNDLSKIKVYLGDIEIKLGSDENVRGKMSNAINTYKSGLVTEYIDTSFNGTPDFK